MLRNRRFCRSGITSMLVNTATAVSVGVLTWNCSVDHSRSEFVQVTGIVSDSHSVPIENAHIGVVLDDSVRQFLDQRSADALWTIVENDGAFELNVPKHLQFVSVVVRADGWAPAAVERVLLKGEIVELPQIVLAPGISLSGEVLNQEGKPIEGVEIEGRDENPEDTIPPSLRAARTKSDKQGQFTLGGLSVGMYTIRARHQEYADRFTREYPISARTPTEFLEIELGGGAFVEGLVTNRMNKPVSGARVTGQAGPRELVVTESDPQGRFLLGPFAEGTRLAVTTTANGYKQNRFDGIFAPMDDLQVILRSNGTFRGRVLASGAPVQSFEIVFHRQPQVPLRTSPFPGAREFESEDGSFEWPDVNPGTWTVSATAPGYQPLAIRGVLIPEGGASDEVIFNLEEGYSIVGRVLDEATGLAVPSASVRYVIGNLGPSTSIRRPDRPSVTTDEKGYFEFDGLPADRLTLVLSAVDYATVTHEIQVPTDSALEISLTEGGSVSGRLLSWDSVTPVQGKVRLSDLTNGGSRHIRTGLDGQFEFANLSWGSYEVSGEAASGRTTNQHITLNETDRTTHIQLEIQQGATVTGQVRGLMRGEVGRVFINVVELDGKHVTNVTVDEDGTYLIDGLSAKPIRLTAHTSLDRHIARIVEPPRIGGKTTVDFDFTSDASISGRVTRGDQPAPFVILNATPLDGQAVSGSGETSSGGQYTITGLESGRYLISIEGSELSAEVLASSDARQDFELSALSISGQTIDVLNGEALPRARVELRRVQESSTSLRGSAETDSLGEFTFSGLGAGRYLLSAYREGYDLVSQEIELHSSVDSLLVQLGSSQQRIVQVRDAVSLSPLRVVDISFATESGRLQRLQVSLDQNGVATIPEALMGLDLDVSWSNYISHRVERWDGGPTEILLQPEAASTDVQTR